MELRVRQLTQLLEHAKVGEVPYDGVVEPGMVAHDRSSTATRTTTLTFPCSPPREYASTGDRDVPPPAVRRSASV
ncbi:hypothetical protein SMICM304S_00096 [Streptomyces microflavus]